MLTVVYGMIMAMIPRTLKSFAVFQIVAGSKRAVAVLIAAKVVFWVYAYFIGMIWYPNMMVVGGICAVGLILNLLAERKYLIFPFRPNSQLLAVNTPKNKAASSVWERIYQSFSFRKSV